MAVKTTLVSANTIAGGHRVQAVPAAAAVAALLASSALTPAALANPQDGSVVRGDARITTADKTVTIQQSSDRAVINWGSFSIDADELTRFEQPSERSVALNRVVGNGISEIQGALEANGRIVLVNPRGILITDTARIDVAGLIASTADIDDDDFMAGRGRFGIPADPSSFVVNRGDITIKDGGLAAFVAPWVANAGVIRARLGEVALASGETFTAVDLYGDGLIWLEVNGRGSGGERPSEMPEGDARLVQAGRIEADGGSVHLSVAAARGVVDNVINMTGIVRAQTVEQRPGSIVLRADEGDITVAGSLDASGGDGILAGGDVFIRTGGSIDFAGADDDVVAPAAINVSGEPPGTVRIEPDTPFVQPTEPLLDALLQRNLIRPGDVAPAEVRFDPAQGAVVTLLAEFAGAADTNVFGIYDVQEPEKRVTLFEGAARPGDRVAFSFTDADGGLAVAVGGEERGCAGVSGPCRFSGAGFGFFLDSRAVEDGGLFFDERNLNPDDADHVAGFDPGGGATAERTARIVAGEDTTLPPGDGDFNDAVVLVRGDGDIAVLPPINGGGNGGNGGGNGGNGGGGGDGGDIGDIGAGPVDNVIDPDPGVVDPDRSTGDDGGADRPQPAPTDETLAQETLETCEAMRTARVAADAAVARCFAAVALRSLPENASRALAALEPLLDDPDPERRERAVADLESINRFVITAVPVLVAALGDPTSEVSRTSAGVLSDINDYADKARRVLTPALDDPAPRVRRAAARSLAGLGAFIYGTEAHAALAARVDTPDEREEESREDLGVSYYAADGLIEIDAQARAIAAALESALDRGTAARTNAAEETRLLAAALREDRGELRHRGIAGLRTVGPRGEERAAELAAALAAAEADIEDRRLAVEELAEINDFTTRAVPRLVGALPEDEDLRAEIRLAEGPRPLKPLVGAGTLIDAVKVGREPEVRRSGAVGLRETSEAAGESFEQFEQQLAAIKDDPGVGERVVETVNDYVQGRIRDYTAQAAEALIAAVKEGSLDTRGAAVEALGLTDLELPEERSLALTVTLIDTMKGGPAELRPAAARALGRAGAARDLAPPALAEALGNPDPAVRIEAARALARRDPEQARPFTSRVRAALYDADPAVRHQALRTLDAIGSAGAVTPEERFDVGATAAATADELASTVADPATDAAARRAALRDLRRLGSAATDTLPVLLRALVTADAAARPELAAALVAIGDEAFADVRLLVERLIDADDDEVRERAARALGDAGARTARIAPVFVDALEAGAAADSTTRLAAAEVLGEIGGTSSAAVRALVAAAERDPSPDVRREAMTGAGRFAQIEAITSPAMTAQAPAERAGLGRGDRVGRGAFGRPGGGV